MPKSYLPKSYLPKSYLNRIALPVPAGGNVLKPSRRFALRPGEERPPAAAATVTRQGAEPVRRIPQPTADPSLVATPAAPAAPREPPSREAATTRAHEPAPDVTQTEPDSRVLFAPPIVAAPQVVRLDADASVVPRAPLTSESLAVNAPVARGVPAAPGTPPGDLGEASSTSPVSAPRPTSMRKERPPVRARAAAEDRGVAIQTVAKAPPRDEPRVGEKADGRVVDVPRARDESLRSYPAVLAMPVGETQTPSLKIGSIEVRVLPPVSRQAPAPATAPRAPSALSRGFASPFGLRQG